MVSFAEFNCRGPHNWIVRDLRQSKAAVIALARGITGPRLIANVTPSGRFIGDARETLELMMETLCASGRLYRQGNTIVFLAGGNSAGQNHFPTSIVVDGVVTKTASAIVGNVLMCRESKGNTTRKGARSDQPLEYDIQFAVPPGVLQQMVCLDGFIAKVPEAQFIMSHPAFDKDFNWLGVGYHESQRILIYGDDFEPAALGEPGEWGDAPQSIDAVLERLPPLIRLWVEGFHWRSPIDLINFIGASLMIPLMPMLVADGHPGVNFWGNQTRIGKSTAALTLAVLKDGKLASPTPVDVSPREIENQIAGELNEGRTVVFFDNQKGVLNVPILEAEMTAKEIGIRGMFSQRKIRRPNDILWLFTTNDGLPSEDMLTRCVHVHLHYEGVPENHRFVMSDKELIEFVQSERSSILAELAGMVTRWLDIGRPMAPAPSRFGIFGRVVGSVLAANGLPGFLSSDRQEVRDHSTVHQQLTTMAEQLINSQDRSFVLEIECDIDAAGDAFKSGPRPANPREQKDWVPLLTAAGVIPAMCTTPEKQKTSATQYLNSVVKVPIEVEIGEQTVQAMIVSRSLGKRRVAYALAVKGLPSIPGTTTASVEKAGAKITVDDPSAASVADSSKEVGDALAEASSARPSPLPEANHGDGTGTADEENDLWGRGSG